MASLLIYLTVILIVYFDNINGQVTDYNRNNGNNDRAYDSRNLYDRNNADNRNNYGQHNNNNDQRSGQYNNDQRSSGQYNTDQRSGQYNNDQRSGQYNNNNDQRSGQNNNNNPQGQYNNENRYGQYGLYNDHGYKGDAPGSNTDGYYYNTRIRGGVGAGGVGGRFYGNPSDDRDHYHLSTPFPQPGVLAGWRPDLQGRQRPDSINLERDAYVTTSYGQIQGFKVHLYDNPDPKSYFRPGQTPVERIQGNCSVFLGIPYAQPPIREGRFKVRYTN